MGWMNKFALLRAGISAFYYPIKETLTDYDKKVVGFLHYLLTHALKIPAAGERLEQSCLEYYLSAY